MRRRRHSDFASGRLASLMLPVCALIVLSACGSPKRADEEGKGAVEKRYPFSGKPVNSPITVADGSMEVRTLANASLSGNTLTIDGGKDSGGTPAGGQACWIKIGPDGPFNVDNQNWTITSADGKAQVTVVNLGQRVVASTSNSATGLPDGPGAAFSATFSPPTFTLNGTDQPLTCGDQKAWPRCKVWIDYWVGNNTSCPAAPPCTVNSCAGYPH